jgi:hypothetical protein
LSDLPSPLTPLDCDLRDFPFMPLDVARLRRSKAWLKAKRNPALAFYLINLWTASWHDVPAASLEDDDDVLADLAMCDPSKWAKVRDEVLRGWILCADGRLYHPTVAEKALEAWKAKLAQRARTEAARQAKELKRQQALSQTPQAISVTGSVTETVTDSKGEGQGEREGQGQGQGDSDSAPNGAGGKPPKLTDPKEIIFGYGLSLLVNAGTPEKQARSFLGGLDKAHGSEILIDKLRECARAKPLQPLEWLAAALPPPGSAKAGKHAGFAAKNYREGVSDDGSFH